MVLRTHSFLPITVALGAHAIYAGRPWASGLLVPDVVASSANDEGCRSIARSVICLRIPLPDTILHGISRFATGNCYGGGFWLAVSIRSRLSELLREWRCDGFTLKRSTDPHLVGECCLLFFSLTRSLGGSECCGHFEFGRMATRYGLPVANCQCRGGTVVFDLQRCYLLI